MIQALPKPWPPASWYTLELFAELSLHFISTADVGWLIGPRFPAADRWPPVPAPTRPSPAIMAIYETTAASFEPIIAALANRMW
jgi:hypothetical protein